MGMVVVMMLVIVVVMMVMVMVMVMVVMTGQVVVMDMHGKYLLQGIFLYYIDAGPFCQSIYFFGNIPREGLRRRRKPCIMNKLENTKEACGHV